MEDAKAHEHVESVRHAIWQTHLVFDEVSLFDSLFVKIIRIIKLAQTDRIEFLNF